MSWAQSPSDTDYSAGALMSGLTSHPGPSEAPGREIIAPASTVTVSVSLVKEKKECKAPMWTAGGEGCGVGVIELESVGAQGGEGGGTQV